MLLIITDFPKAISERIMSEVEHGVTLISATGAYTKAEKTVLLSVVRPNEVAEIMNIVKDTDRGAFTIITDSNEVLGFGFQNN